VVRLVRDPDARVAATALQAAVDAGPRMDPLRALLVESLGAEDVQVRAAALNGFAKLADPATLPILLDAFQRSLGDPSRNAALSALDALGALHAAGVPVWPSLGRRVGRLDDALLRERGVRLFGEPARARWGDPHPVQTGLDLADYLALVERWVRPAIAGAKPALAVVETAAGTIVLRLFAGEAPLTVESFASLAERGYFDGQEWPRVVPNFVIQGGDPRGDQTGGPGYALRDELNRHRYVRGTLGMALSGPDTGGSQFFITHSPQPHLDGGYTVFGEVMEGFDVVDRVRAGERITRIRVDPPVR
jgi:cyclophilin family peptidyl-prolyl cis-trans isomerase